MRALGEESLRWRPLTDEQWDLARLFLPPPEVLRTMVAAWEYSPAPSLDSEEEECLRPADRPRDLGHLRRVFLDAYWGEKQEGSNRGSGALRHDVHLTEQQFARFLYFRIRLAACRRTESELKAASGVFGVDLAAFRRGIEDSTRALSGQGSL